MTNPTETKAVSQTLNQAEMDGDIRFLRRINWALDSHPRLHELLQQLYDAIEDENALVSPIIQIRFRGENYFLMSEGLADFTIRLHSDFKHRRPPFTQEMLNKLRCEPLEITEETLSAVEHLLFGGTNVENIPWSGENVPK